MKPLDHEGVKTVISGYRENNENYIKIKLYFHF